MLAYTAALAAAIESNAYTVPENACKITLSLPGGVYPDASLTVDSLSINASTTTDLPDDVRLAAGYPAISCTFSLSGDVDRTLTPTLTAAGLFGQYQIASPLYRKSILGSNVTVDIGVIGTDRSIYFLRKFTGTVDSFTVDPVSGSVSFSCIDYRNKLRSVPSIPAVVTAPPYNAQLTSEFAVDALLRAATNGAISSWPAQRPQCVLAAGFRSSLWPEVGSLVTGSYQSNTFGFAPGAYGTALVDSGAAGSFEFQTNFGHTVPLVTGTMTFHIEGFVTLPSGGMFEFDLIKAGVPDMFSVAYMGSNFTAGIGTALSSVSATITTGVPHYIAADIAMVVNRTTLAVTSWSAIVYVDTTSYSLSSATSHALPDATDWATLGITLLSGATLAGMQVTTESSPSQNYGFVPQAVLDPSLNTLQAVPAVSGDPWQVLQQIADAELAVAGFDESTGIFRFTNRNTLRSSGVQRTITSSTSLKNLQIASSAAALADQVTVGYTPWRFGSSGLAYQATSTYVVAGRTTRTFTVTLPDSALAASVDTTVSKLPNGHSTTDGGSYYRASTDSAGLLEHPGVTMTVSQPSSSQIAITVQNTTGQTAYLVSPANYTDIAVGTPSLWIGGVPVTQAAEVTVGQALDSTPASTVAISGNTWIQDDATARQLAFDLLDDLSNVRPDLTGIDIVPDPRLQLMDRVLISDPDTSGVIEYAVIWGWTLSLSGEDWSQTIDARTVASPGQWILGVAGRTELGVTTYI